MRIHPVIAAAGSRAKRLSPAVVCFYESPFHKQQPMWASRVSLP